MYGIGEGDVCGLSRVSEHSLLCLDSDSIFSTMIVSDGVQGMSVFHLFSHSFD